MFYIREFDFVFIYEVKAREFESICLLGYELKKRGYSVSYINTWKYIDAPRKANYKAKVAIVFAAYNTSTIDFALNYIRSCEKVVNMQWEQLFSNGQKIRKNSEYYILGKAKDVVHMAWGKSNYRRLTEDCALPRRNVKIVGHIGLDFLRAEFKNYYMTKDEICKKFWLNHKFCGMTDYEHSSSC